MLLPILFLFKTKISDYFKYSLSLILLLFEYIKGYAIYEQLHPSWLRLAT